MIYINKRIIKWILIKIIIINIQINYIIILRNNIKRFNFKKIRNFKMIINNSKFNN